VRPPESFVMAAPPAVLALRKLMVRLFVIAALPPLMTMPALVKSRTWLLLKL
jgi:hypothetical protein